MSSAPRITLIEPTPPDVSAFGTRALSAFLKSRGEPVRVVFLPGGVEKYKTHAGARYQYDPRILSDVIELCRGSLLVGVSFMSNYLDRATLLCQAIRRELKVPIVAGGIHPTVMPEPCLEFADIVCRGEGEHALLELIGRVSRGEDHGDIPNLAFRRNGNTVTNPVGPPIANLDELPFCDFGTEEHYVYDLQSRRVEPMTKERLRRCFPLEPHLEGTFYDSYRRTCSFKIMTTRGCPHRCTFCAERYLRDMYKGHPYLRKRSVSHVIDELAQIKRELPFVESIFAFDDTFLVRTLPEIEEFSRLYKERIGLPFHIQASPGTTTREKIEALVGAGLCFVEMGVQSVSRAGMDAYQRSVPVEAILKAADIYHSFRGRIHPPCYHVILDNPWETPLDVAETIRLMLKLPRPFWMKRSSLVLFPGTDLHEKARQTGLIRTAEDEQRLIYGKHLHQPHGSYVNLLMYLTGFSGFPRWILRGLAADAMVRALDRKWLSGLYGLMNRAGDAAIVLSKGLRSLLRGDVGRIRRYVARATDRNQ